jgi:hypothetical protein
VASAAAPSTGSTQETGPVYKLEGAWYGTVTVEGKAPAASLDTFTSDAQQQAAKGTALCTIPAIGKLKNPSNPDGWLAVTPSAHGNWVRIGTNTYAYSMVRTLYDEKGAWFGWARFWGTITPISENEYTGVMKANYFLPDGTPLLPQAVSATQYSTRIEVPFDQ